LGDAVTHAVNFEIKPRRFSAGPGSAALAIAAMWALTTPQARAGFISQVPDAVAYAVLYEGTGGHTLHITNVTVNGNVGVGGTGLVSDSGPSTVNGRLDFSASNTGQYGSAPGDTGPTSVNYNVSAVTNALTEVNNLSSSLSGLGSSLTINGNQTVNESAGQLDTVNGVTYRVFNVTSYSENDGKLLTINGDGSGDDVILNFGSSSNVNLGGDVSLTGGLTDDNVLWNFTSSGKNISLNNNASSFPLPLAFMGDILAPNDVLSLTNANLDGRVWGGDSQDMQIVSGDTINGLATTIPEPGSLTLLGAGLVAFGVLRRRQRSRPSPISRAHR
jgi:choice-of-anchor A domain-containing protein